MTGRAEWPAHGVTRLSSYPDLSEAHRQHGALREVVIHHPGGWPDTAALAKVREYCRAAAEAVDDSECRERIASIDSLARDLYSRDGHLRWERTQTSGRDFLRLRILRELNAFDARIIALEEMRRALGHGVDAQPPGRRPPG